MDIFKDKMVTMWPLFWCVSAEVQAAMMQLQWDLFGMRLDIPPEPVSGVYLEPGIEPFEEIEKLMRKPSRVRI